MRGFGESDGSSVSTGELGPGDDLDGDYQILELLGQGAYGRVYRALDRGVGREVAIKVLIDGGGARKKRFLREGQIAAGLNHPSIGKVFSVGEHGLSPFLVYELLEGAQDLDGVVAEWPRERRLEAFGSILEGVAHAHERGVVHRDLKPSNVVVDVNGRCRVIDFGLARAGDSERLTRTGALVGTPIYMAPEGFRGNEVTPASDVWSLGIMLYWLLTDRLPFHGPNLVQLAQRIEEATPPPLDDLDPTISPSVGAVCMRALRSKPSERYPHAGALHKALVAALKGEALPDQRRRPPETKTLVLVAALAAFMSILAGSLALRSPKAHQVEPLTEFSAALESGEFEVAETLLSRERRSPERALLAAQLAEARKADPRPGLRVALKRWTRPELGAALARAELARSELVGAREALAVNGRPRWVGDTDSLALLELLDELERPGFRPAGLDKVRHAAPDAVNSWLEHACSRDFELWRWRHDPRFTTRARDPLTHPEFSARLSALAEWGDPSQVSFASACLSLLGLPGPELDSEFPLACLVNAAARLEQGQPAKALALLPTELPQLWQPWAGQLRGQALLAVGETQAAYQALSAAHAASPWQPAVIRALAAAAPQAERARYQALSAALDARDPAETERKLAQIPENALPGTQVPRLEAVLQADPLSWHARYRRTMVRTTDLDPDRLRAALDAAYWDPYLCTLLHHSVRRSVQTDQGARNQQTLHSLGAFGFLQMLVKLREQELTSWRDRERLAVLEALAVEFTAHKARASAALKLCEQVLEERPEVFSVRVGRAYLLIRGKRFEEADRELRVLEQWAPEAGQVAFYRALWLGHQSAPLHEVSTALARAARLGFRTVFDRWGRARLLEYPGLAAYDGRIPKLTDMGLPFQPTPPEEPPSNQATEPPK